MSQYPAIGTMLNTMYYIAGSVLGGVKPAIIREMMSGQLCSWCNNFNSVLVLYAENVGCDPICDQCLCTNIYDINYEV